MINYCSLPPVLFNCWKHHLGFICQQIKNAKPANEQDFADFCVQLKTMGSSLSDLYTGNLNPESISQQVLTQLNNTGKGTHGEYTLWLKKQKGNFREIQLSDMSRWTLLLGDNHEYYVHIHPSRYSANTTRIKTNLLRTAVALLVWEKSLGDNDLLPETINNIRADFLNLSPVDQMQMQGIISTVKLIRQGCNF